MSVIPKLKQANQFSKFWMAEKPEANANKSEVEKLMDLASMRRAISNFVKIVTQRDIPVRYALTSDESFTDGKTVTVSGKIDDDDFDPTVGLALHESTHCVLTNFILFKAVSEYTPEQYVHKAEKINIPRHATIKIVRDLLNWVEDRRIDDYQYTQSPGYKGYYLAMYAKYFQADIIDEGLKSSKMRNESVDSYMYRIINLINPNTDLDALKGLRKISELLDVNNISRLLDTKKSHELALAIYDIMLDNLDPAENQKDADEAKERKEENGKGKGKGKSSGKSGDAPAGGGYFDEDEDKGETEGTEEEGDDSGEEGDKKDGKEDGDGEPKELSDEEFNDLLKAVRNQRQFMNGKVKKVKLSDDQAKKLSLLLDAKADIKQIKLPGNAYNQKTYRVVVMREISNDMFESTLFPFSTKGIKQYADEVAQGIVYGTILGKKLKIRNEERETIFTRKETGRIDKRLIAEFGFGSKNLFSQRFIEKYAKAIVHVSVDVSGSMAGKKLGKAITTAVAICKAASMTQNLDVVVSLRGTLEPLSARRWGMSSNEERQPVIAVVYDSRVDTFGKVVRWFPFLTPSGLTPEGLCFAAIADEIKASTHELKSYFLNFSDGEPYYGERDSLDYAGDLAAEHTAGEIKKFRLRGVNILSYFIEEDDYSTDENTLFKKMYGNDAKFINTDNMTEVANTMNQMFLASDSKI